MVQESNLEAETPLESSKLKLGVAALNVKCMRPFRDLSLCSFPYNKEVCREKQLWKH